MTRTPNERSIRLSESVSPFGPGAIIDMLGESFMAPTGDHWPPERFRQPVVCDPLSSRLNVSEFWSAPSQRDAAKRAVGLELSRFPAWLFCQECRGMTRWTRMMERGKPPVCPGCEGRLVPMRFVAVCTSKSHVADAPWPEWVHRGDDSGCKARDRLRFVPSRGASEGLDALAVDCDACGATRSLGDLRGDVLLREGLTCRGSQPWEAGWGECGEPVEIQQRGSTSLHFNELLSAIDIPEVEGRSAETAQRVRQHPFYLALLNDPAPELQQGLIEQMAKALQITEDAVLMTLAAIGQSEPNTKDTMRSLRTEEFEAFVNAFRGAAPTMDFVARPSRAAEVDSRLGQALIDLISEVLLVDRLREVRVATGFRRYRLDAQLVDSVSSSATQRRWLPAVEGFGEGVFVRLNGERVDAWARQAAVVDRLQPLSDNQRASTVGQRLPDATAQYVLLHTLAHALMSEFAFRSGYSAASLRERIYCENEADYGVFVYTTSSDIEGTLGGLVRQGEPDLLEGVLTRAVRQLAWCGNDPVCSEAGAHSIDGLDLAACHSCVLAPETSCESLNLLLDRGVVAHTQLGFFSDYITQIDAELIARQS